MNKNFTATFIGHNECFELSKDKIKIIIKQFIEEGVINFISGGQGNFDRLCANCVYELKQEYPYIKNYLVIPYLSFKIFNKNIFDEIIFPEEFERLYFKAAIPAKNKYLVQHSKYSLCYVNYNYGGAAKTLNIAIKNNLNIVNLGNLDCSNITMY